VAADLELEKIRAAYRRERNEVDALFNEGLRHRDNKRWPEAIAALQNCLALDAYHSSAWYELGMAYYRQNRGNCEAEYEPYTRCIALHPTHTRAHNNLGLVLQDVRKDYDGAARHYRKAIELDPKQTSARWNLSFILEDQENDIPGAIELIEECVRLGGIPGKNCEQRLATLRRKLEASP